MKLRAISAKNFKYLVGLYNPTVLRVLDEKLYAALRVPLSRGQATHMPICMLHADGSPVASFGVLLRADGAIKSAVADLHKACGFQVNGTQIVVSAYGWTVAVPLNAILKGAATVEDKHIVYSHTVGSKEDGAKTYVGMTKQGLLKRYQQHLNSAYSGSPYLFHKALLKYQGGFSIHQVLAAGLTKDEAEDYEEMFIAGLSLHPKGLNMVPGGKSGLAYLRSIGALNDANKDQPKDKVITDFFSRCGREGRPNPLISARWKDDGYAESIICGNPRNLSVEQVQQARTMLSLGASVEDVVASVGIRNMRIAESLAAGKTYGRVH